MTDLAKLVVRLEAQTGQYQAQLEKAQNKLEQFEKAGSGLLGKLAGVVAGISFLELGKSAIDSADRMGDLAKQTGIAVESLSRLDYAAQQSGGNTEVLTAGLRNLAKAAVDAKDGTGEGADALRAIGVSATDASGNLKDSESLLIEIADAFSQYEDGAAKSAVAQKLFGRSGAELIPFLNQGAAGIKQLTDEADRLGITISGTAAKAADEFNDSINRAKATVSGFIVGAITPMLPMLSDVFDEFTNAAGGARDLSGATSVLQTGLKLLVDFGMSVAFTFRAVGKDLGALAAAAVKFATGNFSEAATILRERRSDDLSEQAAFQKALDKLWGDGLDTVAGTVEQKAEVIRKKLNFGDKPEKLDEFVTRAAKIYVSPMEKFYQQLDEDTQTTAERQIQTFRKTEAEINELVNSGRISQEEGAKRTAEALDTVLPEVEVKVEKIGNKINQKTKDVSEFTKRAMELTVDTIADTLYKGITGKLDNIPKAFADMLLKIALQAEAAHIGELLFGTKENGRQGSGFLGTIGSLISSAVGSGKASGGPVVPGTIYPINEATPNTEWFAPAMAGTVIPANRMGGARQGPLIQNFTIQAPRGTVSRQTESQVASAAGRGIAQSNRKNG